MHVRRMTKPDGRALVLYGHAPIDEGIAPVAPLGDGGPPNPHLRWHPLRCEWIAYAGHRQLRTFLPTEDPLARTVDPENPTELPPGEYDVAVFENRFPTFHGAAHDPPSVMVSTLPARGTAEVVVFTHDARGSLGALPLWHLELLVDVWADRTRELGLRDDVQYVFPFENRGVEVGVTLHHPHGQIYAYPFVPPLAARELAAQREYWENHGRGLLEDHLAREIEDEVRIVHLEEHAVALIPVFARYAYEVWIAPRRAAPTLVELSREERRAFARTLGTVLRKLDALWGRPFPYVMAFHQAPTDGAPHPEAHLHVEIYPAYRMPGRLKYLAGSELGAGVFTADTLPETKAAELRGASIAPVEGEAP
ncbi:MAG: galactose-1-phosphate uridylyltransferase [Deltaproteobacteria bacterium]|nr:galactose-1-phosphate uridylyltransferase [Deltaproteobacteria bacterium]